MLRPWCPTTYVVFEADLDAKNGVDEAFEAREAVEPGVADEVEAHDEAVLLLGITEVSVTMTAVVWVDVHVNVTVPLSLGHDMGV